MGLKKKVTSQWSRMTTLLSLELPFMRMPNSFTKVVKQNGLSDGVMLIGPLSSLSLHGLVDIIWLSSLCSCSQVWDQEDGCSNSILHGTQRCYHILSRWSSRKLGILEEPLNSSSTSKILRRLMLMPLETT